MYALIAMGNLLKFRISKVFLESPEAGYWKQTENHANHAHGDFIDEGLKIKYNRGWCAESDIHARKGNGLHLPFDPNVRKNSLCCASNITFFSRRVKWVLTQICQPWLKSAKLKQAFLNATQLPKINQTCWPKFAEVVAGTFIRREKNPALKRNAKITKIQIFWKSYFRI